jgi:hypothetical protein
MVLVITCLCAYIINNNGNYLCPRKGQSEQYFILNRRVCGGLHKKVAQKIEQEKNDFRIAALQA